VEVQCRGHAQNGERRRRFHEELEMAMAVGIVKMWSRRGSIEVLVGKSVVKKKGL
jgi:hypothetical protein